MATLNERIEAINDALVANQPRLARAISMNEQQYDNERAIYIRQMTAYLDDLRRELDELEQERDRRREQRAARAVRRSEGVTVSRHTLRLLAVDDAVNRLLDLPDVDEYRIIPIRRKAK